MPFPLPIASRAFVLTTATSLAADALLATLTTAVRVTGGGGPPWWIAANLVDRGRWVAFALLLLAVGGRPTSASPDAPAVWRRVGVAAVVAPLLWVLATWIVQSVLFTLAGRWDIDGQMYLAPAYYRRLLVAYVPWLAGGAVTIAASRHLR